MLHVALIIGTRPQIIKSVPIIDAALRDGSMKLSIVHTGQHYDYALSQIFFSAFHLPQPVVNLEVGSACASRQIGEILMRLEGELAKLSPDYVVIPGDTNSALAGGLCASKLGIPVAHVEAGARSYEFDLPEEINRRLLDHLGSTLFAPTSHCARNLKIEGISNKKIFRTGDTMYDLFRSHLPEIMANDIVDREGLTNSGYALLTFHRQATLSQEAALEQIVNSVLRAGKPFVFPIHPHTRTRLDECGLYEKLEASQVRLMEPVGYFETLKLAASARVVVTDSGGLQKEAFWVGTPCVTLRERTEWMETVRLHANTLVGTDERKILAAVRKAFGRKRKFKGGSSLFGNGRASERIITTLSRLGN
jgi:UDP-N-acetylglucosamine 2-epimerase